MQLLEYLKLLILLIMLFEFQNPELARFVLLYKCKNLLILIITRVQWTIPLNRC